MFLCFLPLHHPGPEGTAALFNVDSGAVCPDVSVAFNSNNMSMLNIFAEVYKIILTLIFFFFF